MPYSQNLIVFILNLDCCGAPDQRNALFLGRLQLFVLALNPFYIKVAYMRQRFSYIFRVYRDGLFKLNIYKATGA